MPCEPLWQAFEEKKNDLFISVFLSAPNNVSIFALHFLSLSQGWSSLVPLSQISVFSCLVDKNRLVDIAVKIKLPHGDHKGPLWSCVTTSLRSHWLWMWYGSRKGHEKGPPGWMDKLIRAIRQSDLRFMTVSSGDLDPRERAWIKTLMTSFQHLCSHPPQPPASPMERPPMISNGNQLNQSVMIFVSLFLSVCHGVCMKVADLLIH